MSSCLHMSVRIYAHIYGDAPLAPLPWLRADVQRIENEGLQASAVQRAAHMDVGVSTPFS